MKVKLRDLTEVEIGESSLTDKEKQYLENLLRPFRRRDIFITKERTITFNLEFITIWLDWRSNNRDKIYLPYFKAGEMYNGLKIGKSYTTEELGLFKESIK